MIQSHHSIELESLKIGEKVILAGWLQEIIFESPIEMLLRDQYGLVKVLFKDPLISNELIKYNLESVVRIECIIQSMEIFNNIFLPKVLGTKLELLSESGPLPFSIFSNEEPNASIEANFRHLTLRKPQNKNNILFVQETCNNIRSQLNINGFQEVNLLARYCESVDVEVDENYIIPSRLSLAPLLETIPDNFDKCFQFIYRPIDMFTPLPFGIKGLG
jgi:aspartyl-tRNA synthetase